ncbi:hypothetical protein RB600_007154 [Gaeumannomyces tritici]
MPFPVLSEPLSDDRWCESNLQHLSTLARYTAILSPGAPRDVLDLLPCLFSTTEAMQQRQRRYHQRSRNGCQQCKTRHVRCDSGKPVCENCRRMGVGCVYTGPSARATRESSLPRTPLQEAEASTVVSRRGESARLLHQLSPESLRASEPSMTTPMPARPHCQQEIEYPRTIRGLETEASENRWGADLPHVTRRLVQTPSCADIASRDMTIWPQSGFIYDALPQASAALPQLASSVCQPQDPGARSSRQGQDGYQTHAHLPCACPQQPDFGLGMRATAGEITETAVDSRINEMRSPLPMPDDELPMMLLQHPILNEVEPLPDAQKQNVAI